jgi:CRISPR/Cas system-associated endonuclease Cas1
MANMSYCRFRNTLRDLKDCLDKLEGMESLSELGMEEAQAAREMWRAAESVVEELARIRGIEEPEEE